MEYYKQTSIVVVIAVALPLLVAQAAMATSSASSDTYEYEEEIEDDGGISDPLEFINRPIYKINKVLDTAVLKPLAKLYRFVLPDRGRRSVGNALENLHAPVTAVNAALQGDVKQTTTTFWRFVINSTVGIGGLFDVAAEAGLFNRREDFGQTLGHYDVGAGPYLMLPLFGPSNVRDGVGKVVDVFTDPFLYTAPEEALLIRAGVDIIHTREALLDVTDEIERTSFDEYAAIRSMYTQRREALINNRR